MPSAGRGSYGNKKANNQALAALINTRFTAKIKIFAT